MVCESAPLPLQRPARALDRLERPPVIRLIIPVNFGYALR